MSQLALTGPEDWDLLSDHADALRRYCPAFDTLQFKHHLAGLTTYTPDRRFLIGPIPGVENAFVASGCCGTGVSCAGGIGRLMCDLIRGRKPEVDAGRLAPDRFGSDDPRSEEFIARCVASASHRSATCAETMVSDSLREERTSSAAFSSLSSVRLSHGIAVIQSR